MPSDNGFWRDDQECLLPAGQAAVNEQPEEPVEPIQPWAPTMPLEHDELLAKDQVLDQKSLTRTQKPDQRSEAEPKETKNSGELQQNTGGDDSSYVIDSKAGRSFGEPHVMK